jgi:hypothetical protein
MFMRRSTLAALTATMLAVSATAVLADDCTDFVAQAQARLDQSNASGSTRASLQAGLDQAKALCKAGSMDEGISVASDVAGQIDKL